MPELPDVQAFKGDLDRLALRRRIADVEVLEPKMLEGLSQGEFRKKLIGKSIESSRRYGKYLFARLDSDGWLMFHFGMTGGLAAVDDPEDPPGSMRLRIDFEEGASLAYLNRRKLGRFGVVDDLERFITERELGPDAIESGLSAEEFLERLAHRRSTIKAALMDQSVIAGIGNVYADEILFQAGLHPEAKVDALDEEDLRGIFDAMGDVLSRAIDAGADPARLPDDFIIPHRKEGESCPRCGGEIEKVKVSGRTSYFCPVDQRTPAASGRS